MGQNLNNGPTTAPHQVRPRPGRQARFHARSQFRTLRVALFLVFVAVVAAGCARRPATATVPPPPVPANGAAPPFPAPPLVPGAYVEQGVASWYGYPFHGRRASNGEIFDMNQPVAAHRTLPFGSMVRVTNLNNGLSTDVRIIDRGPFVGGRIIDLSQSAARSINMLGTGTAPVRLDLLSTPLPVIGYFGVQIGAFQQRANAEEFRVRLGGRYRVSLQEFDAPAGHFYRVRVGHEPTEAAAERLAAKLSAELGLQTTFVVRLDDVN